jgi:hypothetical protein
MKTVLQLLKKEMEENSLDPLVCKMNWQDIDKLFEQAKQKEKEQIIEAHTNAYLIGEDDISVEDANKASEEYYNQTYNQNK